MANLFGPQTGNIADYAGRQVDLLVIPGARSSGSVMLRQTLALPKDGGWLCAGVQKLSQRWIIGFMTPLGSIPYALDQGTRFVDAARNGRLRNEQSVQAEFGMALSRLEPALVNVESINDPNDERYGSTDLLGVAVDLPNSRVTLRVRINSLAGSSRKIILPIRTTAGVV